MIGYRISSQALRNLITEHDPDWLTKAENDERPPWSDIKEVFARIQHFKCGYCERPMPMPQLRPGDEDAERWGWRREYDVEHFRPKGAVTRWPTEISGFRYEFETGDAMASGYPWLAHDCLNYLVSCKTCNQDNKKDYFPISRRRGNEHHDVRRLNQLERPFLVNPAAGEIDRLTRAASQHANCARCFKTLHASDWPAAQECYDAARQRSERLFG